MSILAVVGAMFGLLPASRAKNWLMSCLPGWHVHPTANVAPVLLTGVRTIEIGEGATVGLFTSFRHLQKLSLGAHSIVGRMNWISASPLLTGSGPNSPCSGSLVLGSQASITARHHLDCSGGISIGDLAVVAGHGTTMLTHAVEFMHSVQRCAAIRIGNASFISTNCIVTPGVTIADRVVVGAGSTVLKDLTEQESLYAGSPAVRKRSLKGAEFFTRAVGPVADVASHAIDGEPS